jgi:hypothetical protein
MTRAPLAAAAAAIQAIWTPLPLPVGAVTRIARCRMSAARIGASAAVWYGRNTPARAEGCAGAGAGSGFAGSTPAAIGTGSDKSPRACSRTARKKGRNLIATSRRECSSGAAPGAGSLPSAGAGWANRELALAVHAKLTLLPHPTQV